MPAFNDIETALEAHLQEFAYNEGVSVAWRGETFEPSNTAYLRPTFIPGETFQVSMGDAGMESITGIFQVDVFTPKGSERTTMPDDIADHFKRGTSLTEGDAVVRLRTTSISKPSYEQAWTISPITVSWDTYLEAR
jgi:hypothetical protein